MIALDLSHGLAEGGRILEYYYSQGDQRKGPVSLVELRRLAAAGQVLASDLVWAEGMDKWRPAAEVPGLLPSPYAPVAALSYASAGPVGPSQSNAALVALIIALLFAPAGFFAGRSVLKRMRMVNNYHGQWMAMTAYVLGILGFVAVALGLGVFLLCLGMLR